MPKQFDFAEENKETGRKCELCHCKERIMSPLVTFYLDRDVSHEEEENIARVCGPCYTHLDIAMPEGIAKARTQFAFLINRGLQRDTGKKIIRE